MYRLASVEFAKLLKRSTFTFEPWTWILWNVAVDFHPLDLIRQHTLYTRVRRQITVKTFDFVWWWNCSRISAKQSATIGARTIRSDDIKKQKNKKRKETHSRGVRQTLFSTWPTSWYSLAFPSSPHREVKTGNLIARLCNLFVPQFAPKKHAEFFVREVEATGQTIRYFPRFEKTRGVVTFEKKKKKKENERSRSLKNML